MAFRRVPYPVMLINGKYLLTANTMRRHGGRAVENVYRTANWIVRQEWEQTEKKIREKRLGQAEAMTLDEIRYGTEEHARTEQVIEIGKPGTPVSAGSVTVEWIYDKEAALAAALEPKMKAWAETLPEGTEWTAREISDPETIKRAGRIVPGRNIKETVRTEFLWRDPVVLIGARYLVVGSKFDTMGEVLQTVNKVIREELDSRQ